MAYGRRTILPSSRRQLLAAYPRGLGESFVDAAARISSQWEQLQARLPDDAPDGTSGLAGLGLDLGGILNAINGVINGAANVASGVTQAVGAVSGGLPQSQWKPLIDSWYNAAMRGDVNAASNLASYDFGDASANAYRQVMSVQFQARRAAGQLGVGLIGQSNLPALLTNPLVLVGGGLLLYLVLRRR